MLSTVNRISCSLLLAFACTGCPGWWPQSDGPFPPLPEAGSDSPTPSDAGVAEPVTEPAIPKIDGECPTFETGQVEVNGITVQVWLSEAPNGGSIPLLIYWHGTGSSVEEVSQLAPDTLNTLREQGGLVVALTESTEEGINTSTGTWSTGDFAIVDQVVACAAQQLPIDTKRIFTTGCSSGAVHAGVMAYERSSYVAAAALNSGGQVQPFPLQEPGHVPNVALAHGPEGYDVVIIDFAIASHVYATELTKAGGFAVDCGHDNGHCGASFGLQNALWQFLNDHPFGVSPEPYLNGLPDSFPEYCQIVRQ
jgi:hypothetical protein